jgi:hypothetical protein
MMKKPKTSKDAADKVVMCRCNQALTVSKSKAVAAHSGVVEQVIAMSA